MIAYTRVVIFFKKGFAFINVIERVAELLTQKTKM
jgi:hypothetical protein